MDVPGPQRRNHAEWLGEVFERIGGWSFDHRGGVLLGCIALLGACVWLASGVRFDNSFESYFDNGDPAYRAYNRYRDDFGSDEISYILYEAPGRSHGVFDLEVMRSIRELTAELEAVPFVKEVTSLSNAEFLEGVPDGIEIHELLEEFPESQEELLAIRRRVLQEPLYVGGLVSEDGRYAALIVEMYASTVSPLEELRLDPDAGDGLSNLYPQVPYHRIEEILARPEYQEIRFQHVGEVPLNAIYNEVVQGESGMLGGLTLAAIALLLFVFFRRAIGVIGPMVVVALSILVAIAWLGVAGWNLDLMFIMLPTLLIAVGVADSVHIIAEFRAFHAELGDRREAASRTLSLVGPACLLTSLTTAAGMASMSIAPIVAISHFAIYSAVGVMAAFLFSMTLLFVLLSFGRRHLERVATAEEVARAKGGARFQRGLAAVAHFDVRHRRAILSWFALLFVVSTLGIARLRVDSNFMHEFSADEPVRRATEYVDGIMGGTLSVVYLFDSGHPEGIVDPQVLGEIERVQREAETHADTVQKTYSVADVIVDLNQAFHEEDPSFRVLPETRDLTAQYLLLYEMSGGEEVRDYVSSDFARASLQVRSRTVATSVLGEMVDGVERYLEEQPVTASSVSVTGVGALWLELQDYITRSQIRGFLLAFIVIAALLCFVFQSLRIGMVAMIPNLSPVVFTLGFMGWFDIPLDYVRLLIASVAIGISVDDTIHHVMRYQTEFRRSGSYERALHASMADVGRALFITSAVLVVGFLMLAFSRLDTMLMFGSLLAITIAIALIADFFLMPALVMTVKPFGPEWTAAAAPARSDRGVAPGAVARAPGT